MPFQLVRGLSIPRLLQKRVLYVSKQALFPLESTEVHVIKYYKWTSLMSTYSLPANTEHSLSCG